MKKRNIILIHILYWFYIINQLLFPVYVGSPGASDMVGGEYFKDVVISLLLNVISFYAVYFAFPRFSAVRNVFLITGIAVSMIIAIIAVRVPLNWYFWKIFGNLPPEKLQFEWIWVWNELRMVVITGIYAILIRFMINMFETQKLRDELINQRQAGELAAIGADVGRPEARRRRHLSAPRRGRAPDRGRWHARPACGVPDPARAGRTAPARPGWPCRRRPWASAGR